MRINKVMKVSLRRVVLVVALMCAADSVRGEVRLPAIISNHMVIQAGAVVPIWGWASPGEEVVVRIGETAAGTKAGADGRWKVTLSNLAAGGPHQLSVKGSNALLIGDVLLCGHLETSMASPVRHRARFPRNTNGEEVRLSLRSAMPTRDWFSGEMNSTVSN